MNPFGPVQANVPPPVPVAVRFNVCPTHKGPLLDAVTVGSGFTVIVVPAEVAEQPLPFVTVTVYVPDEVTVMDCVVAPVDQAFPVVEEDVRTTEPPEQKVVGPPVVIVGVAGSAFTVTVVVAEVAEQPFPFVTVTE